ncbi:MAG: PEP/pyruvate-binding domain-containing protein, partial [Verrucomicrobiota bacterium]
LEDPIMKASHYDGYARSRTPPIPLLQVPKASEAYADLNGKYVLLEAAGKPDEKVALTETTPGSAVPSAPVGERLRLQAGDDRKKLYEIHGKMTDETVRALQKQVGAKAANYAFLRSTMPLGETRPEEHNYPGFAIPFVFYQEHVERNGIDGAIAKLATLEDSQEIKDALLGIQEAIMAGSVDRELMGLIRDQMENRFRGQHRIEETAVKMRFRSSSNAEDNKDFSGAGLYESHPAYYAYTKAPAAEYAEQEESQRDIPMAIKKVWASVWKAEAYLARERAGIVQETVRMGILVHPSYRKEDATGVVFYYGPDDIEIVANKDNENVQNPSVAGLTPEMHRITTGGNRESDRSSRYILSGKEVLSAENRAQLLGLIELVAPRFREVYPEQGIQGVDVEFKLMEVPDGTGEEVDVMMLKQIRPLADRVTP